MKKISKGLLSFAVAFALLFSFNFNTVFAYSDGCGLYYEKNQNCTTDTSVSTSSAHTINVYAANYSNNNVRVTVFDSVNNATVYSTTMYSDGNTISVTLNNVYSRYKIKLTCLETVFRTN